MKFIHTGDLHLASPFLGIENIDESLKKRLYNSTFQAFKIIVDAAITQKVDFMIISGDIYDNDQHSIAAEDFFIQQCQRLNEQSIPVYLEYGNHDFHIVDDKLNYLPDNVFCFKNHIETKRLVLNTGQIINLTGFSYARKWITEDMANQFPLKKNCDYQIGILHGALKTNNPQQDHYAPFTIEELQNKNYDYWALGHIHKHQTLSRDPSIVYCGNPQGRHKNEAGLHGYYLVNEINGKLVPTFQEIRQITWDNISINLQNKIDSTDDLINFIKIEIKKQINSNSDILHMIDLQINDHNYLTNDLKILIQNHSLLISLRNQQYDENICIYNLFINQENIALGNDIDQKYWSLAENDILTNEELWKIAEPLMKNNFYLNDYLQNPDHLQKIKEKVKTIIKDRDFEI